VPGVQVAANELVTHRRRCRVRTRGRSPGGQAGAGAQQRVVDRRRRRTGHRRRLHRGEAEHVPQQQHGAAPGRQELDGGDERQLDVFTPHRGDGRIGRRVRVGDLQEDVGIGLQPRDLVVVRRRRQPRVGRGGDRGGQHPPGPVVERRQTFVAIR
jgi:hypothetical protein